MEGSSFVHYNDSLTSTVFSNYTPGPSPSGKEGANDWWKELVHSPNWPELWDHLRWAWHLHIYGMACLFMALGCASFFTILVLRAQLSSRPHLSSLNVFLAILGTARAMSLFIDPYGSKKTMPLVMSRIMWDLGYPCLLSAFALLQLSFLTRMKTMVPSSRLSSETAASVIVTSHFCLIIMSNILWALRNSFRIVWLLTQVIFVLWGLFLCLTFLCGCLRLLRTVAKLPLSFLSQMEPGNDIKGRLGLRLPNGHNTNDSSRRSSRPSQLISHSIAPTSIAADNRLRPKIHITDVNDHTYSYVSDGSPAPFNEQRNEEDDTLRSLPILESTFIRKSWSPRKAPVIGHPEDPALMRPLMSDREAIPSNPLTKERTTAEITVSEIRQNGPATISALHKEQAGSFVHRPLRMPSTPLEEFKFDARKLKISRKSRLEKLLRRLVVTSVLGTLLCLLRAYDIFGPHGLSSTRRYAAVFPWFFYQTLSRIVELFMGCSMACITRQSFRNQCYHYCGGSKKHRDPFCYASH